MKVSMALLAVFTYMAASAAAAAPAAESLAKKSGCFSCHSTGTKVIGPSFKEIAARYKGDKNAESRLMEVIRKGGSGTWGSIPMPADPRITEDESKTLVQWILSL